MLQISMRAQVPTFRLELAFETQAGEMMALFGPSGSGKSLTLRCLAGLLRPETGRIVLNGRVLFDDKTGVDLPPRARRMGYVPQHYALFPHLTVAENIAYGVAGKSRAEVQGYVSEMLQLMRLEGLEARRPKDISGGQQQRVALARALATKPEVLLLDEPFAALDGAIRGRLQNELLAIQHRFGIPTVLVTHDLSEAYALSNRIAVVEDGRLLQVAPKETVLRQPVSRAVARFVGTKNIFEATVVSASGEGTFLAWGRHIVQAPATNLSAGQSVVFCIRPEEIMIVRPDRPLRPDLRENVIGGRLVGAIDRGATHTLFVKLDGLSERDYELDVLIPHHAWERLTLVLEQAVAVSLKRSAVHVLAGPG